MQVPVTVRATPPDELVTPLAARRPVFIAPNDPSATSALDAANEDALTALIDEMAARLRAWRAWATDEKGP
ncbi:MAG: hypothetical protein AB7Q97_01780 [Gammaproteobacteria bacterium]